MTYCSLRTIKNPFPTVQYKSTKKFFIADLYGFEMWALTMREGYNCDYLKKKGGEGFMKNTCIEG
jgi:hypothetical protein